MARAGCRFISGNGDKEHKQKQEPAFSGSNFSFNNKTFAMDLLWAFFSTIFQIIKDLKLFKNYLFAFLNFEILSILNFIEF